MTPKIRIRPYEPADVDGVCEAVRESMTELTPWMSWCHPNYSRQDAIAWVEGRPKAWESKEEYSFVIVDSSERILGSCGLHRLDIRNGAAELGYWVRSSATRQGVATAAVRELCAWAFSTTDLHRLEILTAVTNAASQRVAENREPCARRSCDSDSCFTANGTTACCFRFFEMDHDAEVTRCGGCLQRSIQWVRLPPASFGLLAPLMSIVQRHTNGSEEFRFVCSGHGF